MSVVNNPGIMNLLAGADLSTKQYYLVTHNSADDTCELANANADHVLGSLANKPASGEIAEIMAITHGGTIKVKLGGTVAKGAPLMSHTDGTAVTASSANSFGRAMAAGVSGDVIEVEVGREAIA